MHRFANVTLFVVLPLEGVDFSVSAFLNPAHCSLHPSHNG